jgi:hypothetical protein
VRCERVVQSKKESEVDVHISVKEQRLTMGSINDGLINKYAVILLLFAKKL